MGSVGTETAMLSEVAVRRRVARRTPRVVHHPIPAGFRLVVTACGRGHVARDGWDTKQLVRKARPQFRMGGGQGCSGDVCGSCRDGKQWVLALEQEV